MLDVDSGLLAAGDPSFREPEDEDPVDFAQNYEETAVMVDKPNGWPGKGVVVRDLGEGTFPVYVKRNSQGRIKALKIVFDDVGKAADEEQ